MDLPAELKLLLQYMVMLPRGHMFEKDWLVMKWMNEGLTHTPYPGDIIRGEFMMLQMWFRRKREAEVYFSELVDRNIITRAAPNWQHNLDEAEPCQWKVNHCMLQFLASISSRTHFVVTGAVLGGSLWGAEEDAPLLDFDIARRDYSTNAERGIEFIMPDVRCIGLSFENELIRSRGDEVETEEMAKKKQEEIAQKKRGTKDMVITRPPLIAYPAPENWIPRRLALHGRVTTDALRRYDWSTIRSLAVSGEQQINLLDCFTYLVVLDLEQWDDLKDEDILQICNSKMYALRHLSIRNTQVSKLPPQIKELYSLMTLDVSHIHINELPSEVFQLQFLIKLDLTSTKIGKVPKLIAGLQNLQYLLIGGDGIAAMLTAGIRLPDKIVKLATVNLSDCSMGFVKALWTMRFLSVLAITCSSYQCTDKVYQEALLSLIETLWLLKSLTIHCQLGCSMEFLDLITDPPKKLEKLKVETGRFVSVPQWIDGLQQLAFLQITVCKLEPGNLEILWCLPKLKSLVLGLEFIPREQIAFECEGFHELMEFSVDCPVPWLTFRHGAMPKLTYLQLKFCSGPGRGYNVPSGICNLRMITEVVLCYNEKWCANSSSVKRTVEAVKKEVAKHHNPINLVINGTRHDVPEFNELEMPSD
ncbi:hypothetical protein SETIT_8G185500v2 [Setaria italica]|uniref:Disease resistance R13L4/SHOC-2-like LRR domain-containing protein n=2 Tax=Setaria italica TaxID=4555 RepID=A0A368S954_SETIT|nr:hypothetical protein SETIT_8G185500v2 [Setaria italica]